MSDTRVVEDIALLGICDQLSDEELDDLGAYAEDGGDDAPAYIVRGLTRTAEELLVAKFRTEAGRLQVLDAVEMEQNERAGR